MGQFSASVNTDVPGIETASAGTNRGADTPVSAELIAWADVIFVMEQQHQKKLTENFAPELRRKRVICLGIPDEYKYMQPELIDLLELKVSKHLGWPRRAPEA